MDCPSLQHPHSDGRFGYAGEEQSADRRETGSEFYELTQPTAVQQRALDLLSVSL